MKHSKKTYRRHKKQHSKTRKTYHGRKTYQKRTYKKSLKGISFFSKNNNDISVLNNDNKSIMHYKNSNGNMIHGMRDFLNKQ